MARVPSADELMGQVLEALAELLPDDVAAVAADQPLRGLGLDSLAVTRLWFGLRSRLGVDLEVERLRRCATASEIVELVQDGTTAEQGEAAEPAEQTPDVGTAGTADTFPLTDLQQAYLLSKQPEFGDDTVGCHIYREFEVEDLDVRRLEQAWLRLVAHHPMLRARIEADGTGRILPAVPDDWALTVRTADERADLRARMSGTGLAPNAFPLFDVAVSTARDGDEAGGEDGARVGVVHLSIDAAVVDGPSLRLLLRQWRALYDEPDAELPAAALSVRDCVEAIDAAAQGAKGDLDYWRERLTAGTVRAPAARTGAPPASAAPGASRDGRCPERRTLSAALDAASWRAARDLAASHDVSPTALVLTVFTEVLARRAQSPDFTLVLTTSHRPRLPRTVDDLLAPLTSTMLFTAPESGTGGPATGEPAAFADALRAVHARLWEGLDHAAVSGIAALGAAYPRGRRPALPVVFTSELDTAADQRRRGQASFADRVVYGASQTSGVTLDHQMWETADGDLGIRWDVVPSAWPAGWTQAAFAELVNRLLALGGIAGAAERPLNELQQSYVVGRASSGGDWNGCQVFHAFEFEHFDPRRLERAWLDLVEQHDVLRSWVGDDGRLRVAEHAPAQRVIPVLDAAEIDAEDAESFVRASADELVSAGLPMDRGPQADLRAVVRADGSATVFCLLDLLAIDGRSIHMLLRDLLAHYADPSRPPRRNRDYAEWTRWRRAVAAGSDASFLDAARATEHWRRRVAELVPGPSVRRDETSRARTRFTFEREGWNAVEADLRAAGIDADAMLAAALAEALGTCGNPGGFSFPVVRWSQVSAPFRPGEYTALSWLTAPPRARATRETARAFSDTLAEDAAADAVSGLTQLRRHVQRHRSTGGFELPVVYTSLLDLTEQPLPPGITAGPWLTCTPDVTLDCVSIREGDRLSLYWDVVVGDFPPGTAAEMFARYREIVTGLGGLDETGLGGLDETGLSELDETGLRGADEPAADAYRLVEEFNDTARPFEDGHPVQHLFEQWALRRPDAPAVQSAHGGLSYGELNAYANRIARALRELGVGPETAVGISVPRGPAMVAAVFGVLKAGGLYVPLEPGLPAERAAAMLEDADIRLLLTATGRTGWSPPEHVRSVEVDLLPPDSELDGVNPPQPASSGHTAYVIFTSGSTGRPKGVAVTHRPVLNLIDWCGRTYGFGPGDLGLCVTSLGFDLSVFDLLGLLGLGAAVYVADEAERKDPEILAALLVERPITFWNSAPTTLNQLAPELAGLAGPAAPAASASPAGGGPGTGSLRLVFLSGDYTPLTLPDKIRAVFPRASIVSLGGATEATVWSNHFPIGAIDPAWTSIPYGKPISNARYYILDAELEPCPIGAEGDLYIGGECLSAGYYRRPELTADRFVRDPFVGTETATMYRTGDRAVYFPDGVIGFRGRQDNQVKIRGFRVELEEIEHRLRTHPSVADVAVLARRDAAGDTRLVAYVISAGDDAGTGTAGAGTSDTSVEPGLLRAHAAAALPDYMVPNVVVQIDGFPATDNGKLDRNALPWPVATGTRHNLLSASSVPESAAASASASALASEPASASASASAGDADNGLVPELTDVFAQLLDCEIDPDADLWDQGVTSFTMVRVARVLKERHGFSVSVADLLDEPTVAGIARRVGVGVGVGVGAGGASVPAPATAPATVAAPAPVVLVDAESAPDSVPEPVDFFSPEDRARFKAHQWNRRRPRPGEQTIAVPVSEFVDAYRPYRATRRDFGGEPLPCTALTGLLSVLGDATGESGGRLYPSAGDTYAVQIYVYVPEGGVTGLPGGAYYYDPADHQLRCLRPGAVLDRSVHFVYNRELHDASSFSLYLVGERRGIEPIYGPQSERFLLLEAGYLAQSLMFAQAAQGVGLCPIGDVAGTAIRELFDLPESAVCLHALLGGPVSRDVVGALPPPFTTPAAASTVPVSAATTAPDEPIAVIGLAGCYPGAADTEELWRRLCAGTSAIGPVPAARRAEIGTGADHRRAGLVGGFLDPALVASESFDSLTFGIAPAEAPLLDPQLRLLLRVVWECLDDAGHTPQSLRLAGRVGVFLGAMWQDHQHVGADLRQSGETARISATASDAAGRISHVFGFTGPSVATDTACSSALTAVHLAVSALRRGECEMALVAAANLFGHPYHLDLLSGLDLLRETDTPGAYDESAPGWLPGEGAGALLLHADRAATAAGDVRHAVIEATALGHSGGASPRFGAPSAARLAESIGEVLTGAGLRAEDVDYVECAAAGAVLADAAELEALAEVFGASAVAASPADSDANSDAATAAAAVASRRGPLAFGTVKPNLGHLEAAAGLAQLTKVVLQLRHQTFAPTLLADGGDGALGQAAVAAVDPAALAAVRTATPWTRAEDDRRPRRALVNAVAAAGATAQVIVREPGDEQGRGTTPGASRQVPRLVPLSADSPDRLRAAAARLADALADAEQTGEPYRLADVAYTLQVGRRERRYRLAMICVRPSEAVRTLRRFAAGEPDSAARTAEVPAHVARAGAEASALTPLVPSTAEEAANAWLAGEPVAWHGLWADGEARRVALPSHQFATVEKAESVASAGSVAAKSPAPAPALVAPITASVHRSRREKDLEHLVRIFCEVTGAPADRVHPHAALADYGLTSVMIAEINARLDREYGSSVPRTLFFDQPDLASIADELSAVSGTRPVAVDTAPGIDPVPDVNPVPDSGRVAIIAVAGRYPDAGDLEAFWRNLTEGRDSIKPLPPAGRRPSDRRGEHMWGGYLDDIELFDPLLFGITPRDAELMDPQERLFLEVCWRLWETGGYGPRRLHTRHGGRVGVFAGSMYNEYPLFGAESASPSAPSTGSALAGIANRVSYTFGLTGPSLTVDTMCSSSLTAIHLAVQSLLSGECEIAVAGGVNLSLHPNKFRQQRQLGMTSSDHRCRAFGADGDGFVPGEGAGAVLLKPLSQALADGDPVLAVILGSAVNHGGHSNGYMVPSVPAQAEVLGLALDRAGVPAETIGYLEAHGTGTALGDPIEVEALSRALRLTDDAAADAADTADATAADTSASAGHRHVLPIGSVKSNIGHLEAAAGIAGLTKVLLQFEHEQLVPSLHADEPNPNIDWEHVPFRVQRNLEAWPKPSGGARIGSGRRAGISSFGAGGANAHLLIEEAPAAATASRGSARNAGTDAGHAALDRVFVLSARTPDQLREVAARLARALTEKPELELPDVAYTLRAARVALAHRAAIVAASRTELIGELERFAETGAAATSVAASTSATATSLGRAPTGVGGPHQRRESLPAADAATMPPEDLARHWVSGGDLPISGGGEPRAIVRLPEYPFARVRCWAPSAAAELDSIRLWTKDWVPAEDEPASGEIVTSQDLILCLCTGGNQYRLADAVSAILEPATVVRLEPETAADMLHALPADRAVTGWIDLTALTDGGPDWQLVVPLLQQVLRRRPQAAPLRVLQLTTGLLGPSAGPAARRAGAATASFVRTLGAEFRRVIANVLDVDAPDDDPEAVAMTVHEAFRRRPVHGETAVRAARHYVPVLRELPPPAARATLAPDRAYVVSGGVRGLGALVAEHLVDRGARRLALLGRHQPEPGTPRAAELSALLERLEARGVRVLTYFGPLTAGGGIEEFLAEVRGTLGPIAGVVHCAGRARRGPVSFLSLDPEEIAEVWEPKAIGFDTLAELCEKDRPEFFVSFSSVSAVLPKLAAGVADYAAANAYLDYAAGDHRYRSINWPVWSESGSAGGGVAGGEAISDAQGLAVLDHVLATSLRGPVLVTAGGAQSPAADENALAANVNARDLRAESAAPAASAVPATSSAPATSAVPATSSADSSAPRWLAELFAAALHVPAGELDPDTDFADLGVESVLLAEIATRLEERLGDAVNPAVLLESPTLNELARALNLAADEGDGAERSAAPPRLEAAEPTHDEHASRLIAVIGIGCRFPGAEGVERFWDLLRAGECAVREVPASRWNVEELYHPDGGPGRTTSRWGGFVDGLEDFDPEYFGMTDEQARDLDPAIRLSLETAMSALCDAGYRAGEMAGRRVGVYLGARMSDYRRRLSAAERARSLGGDQNFIAAWLAHHFDLRGPNLVVDSACSSSLVSVDLACRSLLDGSSELALAGGVEVLLDEEPYLDFGAAGALSPRGRCASFGSEADGFVPGEGCGLLLLKTLPDALRDGDRIHGVINAIAVGNDGRTMGLTTPNPVAQAEVVRRALADSGLSASAVGLIEAHGTATRIGDPMELRALETVFAEDPATRTRPGGCALGSVKSNVGHLFSAAGVAGLIKALLAVRDAQIPPTLFCETPHPRCDFERSVFVPSRTLQPWPEQAPDVPRVAGVSAFGLGGTNAHAVVSSVPERDPATVTRAPLAPPAFLRRRLWRERIPESTSVPTPAPALTPLPASVPELATSPDPAPESAPPVASAPLVASMLEISFRPSPAAAAVAASAGEGA